MDRQAINMPAITNHSTQWAAKIGKNVEPLSEDFARMMLSGFQKCSSLASILENREKGKINFLLQLLCFQWFWIQSS